MTFLYGNSWLHTHILCCLGWKSSLTAYMQPGNNRSAQQDPGIWISKHLDVMCMWICAHDSGSISVWENILLYCKSIPAYKVTSCLCSWLSSYKSAHICGSIQHSRCSIDTLRPEDTERQPAVQYIHLLNLIQFHSSLNLLSPQGNTFQMKCMACWCKNTTQ